LFFSANYDRKLVTKIKFKSSIVPSIDFLDDQQQQQQQQQQQLQLQQPQQQQHHQQHLLDLLETKSCLESPPPLFEKEFNSISQPVVMPTNVKGSNKSNFWIHQPN
jgi:hypothetical protein